MISKPMDTSVRSNAVVTYLRQVTQLYSSLLLNLLHSGIVFERCDIPFWILVLGVKVHFATPVFQKSNPYPFRSEEASFSIVDIAHAGTTNDTWVEPWCIFLSQLTRHANHVTVFLQGFFARVLYCKRKIFVDKPCRIGRSSRNDCIFWHRPHRWWSKRVRKGAHTNGETETTKRSFN